MWTVASIALFAFAFPFPQFAEGATDIKIGNLRAGGNLRLLILQNGDDVSEIQGLLAVFPDISAVDEFNVQGTAPALEFLLDYDVVLAASDHTWANAVAVGDVLADYADAGGGIVLTGSAFLGSQEIQGRLLSDGYFPFDLANQGILGLTDLGDFEASHPIMAGVTTAATGVFLVVTTAAGAKLVAVWAWGTGCVATKGSNVVAMNVFITASGYWTGDIPLLLHNAALWSSGDGSVGVGPFTWGRIKASYRD